MAAPKFDLLRAIGFTKDEVEAALRASLEAGAEVVVTTEKDAVRLPGACAAEERLRVLRGLRRPPSDRAVARWYMPYGAWAGLAMWLEVTADWFGEKPAWP